MVVTRVRRDLPPCTHCGGAAVLCEGIDSGLHWVDCENLWSRDGWHVGTGRYESAELAISAWRRNVDFEARKGQSTTTKPKEEQQ